MKKSMHCLHDVGEFCNLQNRWDGWLRYYIYVFIHIYTQRVSKKEGKKNICNAYTQIVNELVREPKNMTWKPFGITTSYGWNFSLSRTHSSRLSSEVEKVLFLLFLNFKVMHEYITMQSMYYMKKSFNIYTHSMNIWWPFGFKYSHCHLSHISLAFVVDNRPDFNFFFIFYCWAAKKILNLCYIVRLSLLLGNHWSFCCDNMCVNIFFRFWIFF